jgi:hypothetical protein
MKKPRWLLSMVVLMVALSQSACGELCQDFIAAFVAAIWGADALQECVQEVHTRADGSLYFEEVCARLDYIDPYISYLAPESILPPPPPPPPRATGANGVDCTNPLNAGLAACTGSDRDVKVPGGSGQ